jgi:hypothetical protein
MTCADSTAAGGMDGATSLAGGNFSLAPKYTEELLLSFQSGGAGVDCAAKGRATEIANKRSAMSLKDRTINSTRATVGRSPV